MTAVQIDFQIVDIAHSRIFTEMNRADLLLEFENGGRVEQQKTAVQNYLKGLAKVVNEDYKQLKEAFR